MQFETRQGPVAVSVKSIADLKAKVCEKIERNQGFALATINLDHLVKMNTDVPFYAAYQAQDYVVADGNPIVWMGRMAGQEIELLPGSDLILPMCQWVTDLGATVALAGSTSEALAQAEVTMKAACPGLVVTAKISPPFGFDPHGDDARALLQAIHESGARICFIALGAPKQEMLAAYGREIAPQTGFVSIGAGLDFLAGTQDRAPKWVRRLALEWLWRLMQSPSRMAGRYARCFAILPGHVKRALMGQRQ
ncbi:WecB/TagA/CpsF family glycosyltransferase [Cognatishimia maritima]|uniref:Polymer biosynthesis protein, WecB/TagA/CpsF family n=1 Tax=Cognatishimia maritima TaxID=870908 RepID=A0A1M5TUC8_9RHOB|nr:WecB/TagA/CpsF family glycosyltransferase [Cognatishimia maritima]SHH54281.1 polymer biosynthesis protein, WecB/TagA/CpsF family [Cognatishimia maritima]